MIHIITVAIHTTGLHIAKYFRGAHNSWNTGPFRLHDSFHDSPSPCQHTSSCFLDRPRRVRRTRAGGVYKRLYTPPVVYIASPLISIQQVSRWDQVAYDPCTSYITGMLRERLLVPRSNQQRHKRNAQTYALG